MSVTAPAIIIVLGQAKGGTGKSMLAANVAVGLARLGLSVVTIDLDARQRALSRWNERRAAASRAGARALVLTDCETIAASRTDSVSLNEEREFAALAAVLERFDGSADAIVVDTPSGESYLARLAISLCDVLLTPIGEGLADLDVLAQSGEESMSEAELVRQARTKRAGLGDAAVDWVIVRNRYQAGPRRIDTAANEPPLDVAARLGFRFATGMSERAACRSLYARGLSVFDGSEAPGIERSAGSVSQLVAAREEVSALIAALGLRLDGGAVAGRAGEATAESQAV